MYTWLEHFSKPDSVVVVDDSSVDQRFYSMVFDSFPLSTRFSLATCGDQGLDILRRFVKAPEKAGSVLVVTELDLPDMAGSSFLEKCREISSDLPCAMVVATNAEDRKRWTRAKKFGANLVVTKDAFFRSTQEVYSQISTCLDSVQLKSIVGGHSQRSAENEKHFSGFASFR